LDLSSCSLYDLLRIGRRQMIGSVVAEPQTLTKTCVRQAAMLISGQFACYYKAICCCLTCLVADFVHGIRTVLG
jgi:hypothetical protein